MRRTVIISDHLRDRYCVFCGKAVHVRYSDWEPYYECDCDDAVEDRRITKQIEELESSRPEPKYVLVTSHSIEKL